MLNGMAAGKAEPRCTQALPSADSSRTNGCPDAEAAVAEEEQEEEAEANDALALGSLVDALVPQDPAANRAAHSGLAPGKQPAWAAARGRT